MFGLVDVLFYRLLLLACLVLLLSVKKSCESKVVISCFFICLLVPVCTFVCVFVCVCYLVLWPSKIQFNVCYLVLFVCLLAYLVLFEASKHTNNTR